MTTMAVSSPIVCSACGQAKPPHAFYVIRGPLSLGDSPAQPCADCCRTRVATSCLETTHHTEEPEGS
ncbi:MAG: hypothetical protein ACRD0K_09405 [Egibacteraceae bacterium]